jgi:hypothetical protein
MDLAEFIASNKSRLMERWKQLAIERLALQLDASQLVNDLPDFIDDIVTTMRNPNGRWPAVESAACHGRHRMRFGIDIGALTEEMALITEVICELSDEDDQPLTREELRNLTRIVGRGTSASVNAYAAMRDVQLARQAGEHFSFVAHELRTPLQSARLAAALLAESSQADRPKYAQRLERALVRLTELVDNSLVRVRLAATPEMKMQRLQARDLVDAAWEDVVDHAEARGLELAAEVDRFEIEGDRRLLVSALGNLLKNAVKFTRAAGRVEIRAREAEGRALFEVEDECGGMPEDLPARLFRPFLQAHEDKSGFGLGLMIVKQAADAHNGSVRIINHPGRNCCFVLDLPLRQSDSD